MEVCAENILITFMAAKAKFNATLGAISSEELFIIFTGERGEGAFTTDALSEELDRVTMVAGDIEGLKVDLN